MRQLAPLHNRWHGFSRGARPIGFLLFHWHLIQHCKGSGLEAQMATTPYTIADFSPGGSFAESDWPAWMAGVEDASDLQGLADYSLAIERWHNVEGHMVVGNVTGRGEDMMNPLVNMSHGFGLIRSTSAFGAERKGRWEHRLGKRINEPGTAWSPHSAWP